MEENLQKENTSAKDFKIDINKIRKNDYMWNLMFFIKINLAAEALNNEGNIGNYTLGRTISMTNEDVRNAISGDMISHIFTKNLTLLADKDELCDTCKIFSPMKNGVLKKKDKSLSISGNRVRECIVDDACGFANLSKDQEKRNKVVSFSYAIADENCVSQKAIHSRVDVKQQRPKSKSKEKEENTEIESTEKSDQMIMYSDLRSSDYSLITDLNLSRIAFDDELQKYVFEDKEVIKKRIKKVLIAYRNTITDLRGAKCATTMPHLLSIEGSLVHKTSPYDKSSNYSPLSDDFKEVHRKISNSLEFDNIVEFTELIDELINDEYLDFMIERNMNYVKERFN